MRQATVARVEVSFNGAAASVAYLANRESRFLNDLNSSALPDGSRKNMVACSPTSPLKRTYGSMTNLVPASVSLLASASQSCMGRTAAKWCTGTSWESTELVDLWPHSSGDRWATIWWP